MDPKDMLHAVVNKAIANGSPIITEMPDHSHLHALELRLSHERSRLAKCRSKSERALREVWCIQATQEIGRERLRLGLVSEPQADAIKSMSDEDLLRELES